MNTLGSMDRILVTGSAGLLGSAFKHLAETGSVAHDLVFVDIGDADLRDIDATKALFDQVQPRGVIHLAADVGGLYKNVREGVEMLENNLLMNVNVMRCSRHYRVKKLISCLSTCIFPEASLCDHLDLPIDETMIHLGPPHPSNEGYAYAKRLVEVQSRTYRNQYGCNYITLAPTNIFGPNDNYSTENSHVIPALIRKCHKAMSEGSEFVVRGSGRPLRQFIFSRDLAALFLWAYDSYNEDSCLILAPGPEQEVSIADIAYMVAKAFEYNRDIVFDTSFVDGQFKRTVSNAKLMTLNPGYNFTPLEEAIRTSVEWYKTNLANSRR